MADWLTVRDAARVAGVHPNTVRNWLREGRVRAELSHGRHGPTYRIPLEDVVRERDAGDPAAGGDVQALLARLAAVEDERLQEAKARAAAEARLEEVDDLRRELERARAEIKRLRDELDLSRPRKEP